VNAAYRAGRLSIALPLLLAACGRLGYNGLGESGPDAGPPADTLLAAGGCHTCMLQGAALACWGCNDAGQLGTGDRDDRAQPTRITPLSSAHTLAVGGAHSCAVKGGSLSCWGANDAGQLGTGSPDDEVHATPVAGSISWRQVVAGGSHTCGIDSAGALHCWGGNRDGQLGLGTPSESQREPAPVEGEATWRQGSAAGQSTCFLQDDRSLWCWGLPEFAAGPVEVDRAPYDDVAVGVDSICAVRSHDGRLQCTCAGPSCSEADWHTIGSAAGWSRVAAGEAHRCAIDRAGALWCWGQNGDGQLGVGDQDDRDEPERVGQESDWQEIAAGGHHTCGVRGDGSAWCWGADARGELGQGEPGESSPVPLEVSF
jgi:alpha-tubulin suppressor-like RCC1 family protein